MGAVGVELGLRLGPEMMFVGSLIRVCQVREWWVGERISLDLFFVFGL